MAAYVSEKYMKYRATGTESLSNIHVIILSNTSQGKQVRKKEHIYFGGYFPSIIFINN